MIVISGALVVIAIGLLVAGIVVATLLLIYVSIGVSIVSALCLGVGVFVRRTELFAQGSAGNGITEPRPEAVPREEPEPEPATVGAAPGGVPAVTATASPKPPPVARSKEPPPPGPRADVPGGAAVLVVRGRKRYHLATCRQLTGRSPEELAYAEAREQGYAACTACMPDTALAARARRLDEVRRGMFAPRTFAPDQQAEEAEEVLPGTAESGGPGEQDAPPDRDEEPTPAADVRVVAGRKRFHRADCAVVKDAEEDGVDVRAVDREAATHDGCTPCIICRP